MAFVHDIKSDGRFDLENDYVFKLGFKIGYKLGIDKSILSLYATNLLTIQQIAIIKEVPIDYVEGIVKNSL